MNPEITIPKRMAIQKVIGRLCAMIGTDKLSWMNPVLLADLTAGDGCYDSDSTARTMLGLGADLRAKGRLVDMVLGDNNPEYLWKMSAAAREFHADVEIDHYSEVALKLSKGRRYLGGVVLIDPYGVVERMDDIAQAAQTLQRVDFVFSVGAAGCKRAAVSHRIHTRTSDLREAVGKDHWYVMEPLGKHQWTLMLGSSSGKIAPIGAIGFHKTSTPTGRDICERIDMTASERAQNTETTTPFFESFK